MNDNGKTPLKFITCGSVDDGKSTLIGRLLYDSKAILDDQLSALHKDSKKMGNAGDKIDFALLVDGLQSEREQGITIDVAYRYFHTRTRKFIIADTPGHEQYTRNMVTGASTADLAVILIDARKGVLTQTKRHSYIVSLMGIKNIVVAINKMDLVGYAQDRFEEIKSAYKNIISDLPNFESISFDYIPICALDGDNIVEKSANMGWYGGLGLMELLESATIEGSFAQDKEFRFCVQYVNRPHLNFRGFCGLIGSGDIKVGDAVEVLPSGVKSEVASIVTPDIKTLRPLAEDEIAESHEKARKGMSVTITLKDEVDAGRGDMIVKTGHSMRIADRFDAKVVWMIRNKLRPLDGYIMKLGSSTVGCKIAQIYHKKDINNFKSIAADYLELNDIADCLMTLDKSVAFDLYEEYKHTGSFILIDKYTNETAAAGMIVKTADAGGGAKRYSPFELWLNKIIRQRFPHWEAKDITGKANVY